MKIQLLMIIAVIVSSLLTISQRANAQEANQFRWLEPNVEQKCDEVVVPDQGNGSDSGCVIFIRFRTQVSTLTPTPFLHYRLPVITKISGNINPRAPPVSLI
ncbi:hypothetical protein [Marinomonas sp.]|uniref:hypothetical protein n=1 Tax=Marinomonas sp. TaxID=1904862 RepID=UPI003BAB3A60